MVHQNVCSLYQLSMLLCNIHFPGFFTKATNNYFTNIVQSSAKFADNASVEGFIVQKLTFTVDGDEDGIQWSMSQDSFKIVVEKKAFASGLTKNAYKVLCFISKSPNAPFNVTL